MGSKIVKLKARIEAKEAECEQIWEEFKRCIKIDYSKSIQEIRDAMKLRRECLDRWWRSRMELRELDNRMHDAKKAKIRAGYGLD